MEVSEIIAGIDAQIVKLTEARRVLQGISTPGVKVGRGRPKGSKNSTVATAVAKPAVKTAATAPVAKRKLTPEGRKRIADAMKRRWAERRKVAAK